jgi:hypothetical protein
MFRPEAPRRIAIKEPDQAAQISIAWHVEEIAGSPLEFDGKTSPLIEEHACVIDRPAPFGVRNPHGLLALQPHRPSPLRYGSGTPAGWRVSQPLGISDGAQPFGIGISLRTNGEGRLTQ